MKHSTPSPVFQYTREVANEIDRNIVGFNIKETADSLMIASKNRGVYVVYDWRHIIDERKRPVDIANDFIKRCNDSRLVLR